MVQYGAPLYPLQDGQLLYSEVGVYEHKIETATFQQ